MHLKVAKWREPISGDVLKKVKELSHVGARTVAEVQRHLRSYVKDELFRGMRPPSVSRRRFFPTDNDVRNILNAVRSGERKAPDDQSNLEIKCTEWKETHPNELVYLRVGCVKFLCLYKAA